MIISTRPENCFIAPRIPAKLLDFDATTQTYTQEVSTLAANSILRIFGQLYNDAADMGVMLVSQRTGHEVPFVLVREDKHEGETQGWWFQPTLDAVRADARVADLKLLIIND